MKHWRASPLALLLSLVLLATHQAWAGDEDEANETKKTTPPPVEVAAPVAPTAPEAAPDPSIGNDLPPIEETPAPPPKRRAAPRKVFPPFDPDKNVDFSEVMGSFDTLPLDSGVLQPALGFRGYRHNMLALSYGDRTPGFGAMAEYSWNRIGMGAYYAYRPTYNKFLVNSAYVTSQNFAGVYGLYRWLPFDASPYFLLGGEVGFPTDETIGGLAGIGAEARIYLGWTILVGYTYHSVAHTGFFGGAVGWSF